MFLGMQDFDFCRPNLIKFYLNFTKFIQNLSKFYPNYPKLPKFNLNLPKFYPNLPKKKNFARGCGRIPCIPSSYTIANTSIKDNNPTT